MDARTVSGRFFLCGLTTSDDIDVDDRHSRVCINESAISGVSMMANVATNKLVVRSPYATDASTDLTEWQALEEQEAADTSAEAADTSAVEEEDDDDGSGNESAQSLNLGERGSNCFSRTSKLVVMGHEQGRYNGLRVRVLPQGIRVYATTPHLDDRPHHCWVTNMLTAAAHCLRQQPESCTVHAYQTTRDLWLLDLSHAESVEKLIGMITQDAEEMDAFSQEMQRQRQVDTVEPLSAPRLSARERVLIAESDEDTKRRVRNRLCNLFENEAGRARRVRDVLRLATGMGSAVQQQLWVAPQHMKGADSFVVERDGSGKEETTDSLEFAQTLYSTSSSSAQQGNGLNRLSLPRYDDVLVMAIAEYLPKLDGYLSGPQPSTFHGVYPPEAGLCRPSASLFPDEDITGEVVAVMAKMLEDTEVTTHVGKAMGVLRSRQIVSLTLPLRTDAPPRPSPIGGGGKAQSKKTAASKLLDPYHGLIDFAHIPLFADNPLDKNDTRIQETIRDFWCPPCRARPPVDSSGTVAVVASSTSGAAAAVTAPDASSSAATSSDATSAANNTGDPTNNTVTVEKLQ